MAVAASTGGQGNHEGGGGLWQANDPMPGGDGQPCYWHWLRADLTAEGTLSYETEEKEASKDDHIEVSIVTLVNKLVQNFKSILMHAIAPYQSLPNKNVFINMMKRV